MSNTSRKRCPKCCPETESWTNIHDRATSEDGSPVWRCRCCSNELPRRTRRSAITVELERDPARRAAVDALFDRLLAEIESDA
jgi:hypothetical protein